MTNMLRISMLIIFSAALSFAQDDSKDLSQMPTEFNNPLIITTPGDSPDGTLSESFEDPTFPPVGWTKLNPDGGTGWDRFTAGTTPFPGWNGGTVTTPPGGGNAIALATYTTGGAVHNDQWLVTPQITNVQAGDELSFWMWFPFSSYADSVDILISTTGTAAADFNVVVDQFYLAVGSTDTSWTQYTYTLSDYVSAGSDIYIAWWEHVSDNLAEGAIVCVDLVEVTGSGGGGPEPLMSLTHTPGDLNVGIYNNGAIGTEQIGATGPGITWKGEQGCYMGGVLFGDATNASVNGVFGAFTSGGVPVINDLNNVSSDFAGGFMSDANFDQITEAVLYDSSAPAPYNTEIIQRTYSNAGDDFVFLRYGFINRSGSNIIDGYSGIAIDWDIGAYATNSGGYGLDNSLVYQLDTGPTSTYYFGMAALDGAGGVRTTPESAFDPPFSDVRLNIYNWVTTFDATIQPDGDFRSYLGSGPKDYPIGDTVWTTYTIIAGDDLNQLTANALDASNKAYNLGWTDIILPVELSSFTANVSKEGNVILNWTTATEVNNQMFEIERKTEDGEYFRIGYVEGHGTTTETHEYAYVDNSVETGTYFYRLKQIDFNGRYEYSDAVEIEVNGPLTYRLDQNYPNPFNPSTNIKYSVPENGLVRLTVYNLIGEEVRVLVNSQVEAGFYEVSFDASTLPSGAYFYKLQAGNTVQVKKMLLMK